MAQVIHPKRWGDQKPSPGTQINWGHPLARGLTFCLLLNEGGGFPIELVRNRQAVIAGTAALAWAPTRLGPSRKGDGVNTGDKVLTVPALTVSQGFSVCALAITNVADSAFRHIFRKGNNILLIQNSSNAWAFYAGGTSNEYADTTRPILVGERVMLVGTTDGNRSRLYTNGVLGENVVSVPAADALNDVYIGQHTNGTQRFNGWIGLVLVYSRTLRQDEAVWLTAEPYAMFQPQQPIRRVYFDYQISPSRNPITGTPWDSATGTPWPAVTE